MSEETNREPRSRAPGRLLRPTPFKAGLLIIVLACLLYHSFGLRKPELLQTLDNQLTAAMFRWRGAQPTHGSVVIVDIDEKSLARIGQWPWPRNRVAELIGSIRAQGAGVVGMDILFAEPDRTSPARVVGELIGDIAGNSLGEAVMLLASAVRFDHDRLLGEAFAEVPSVLGYAFLPGGDSPRDVAATPFPSWEVRLEPEGLTFSDLQLLSVPRVLLNIPEVSQGLSEGFFNVWPDPAGTVVKVPLVMLYDGIPYPSLALECARVGLGQSAVVLHGAAGRNGKGAALLGVSLGERFVPTDSTGQVMVNYRGPNGAFPYVSASDLMEGKAAVSLKGKIVLIGTSATGLLDLQATAFSSIYPGVEVHATVIDNIIAGDPLRHDLLTEIGVTYCLIIAGGLLICALLAFGGPVFGAMAALSLTVGAVLGCYHFLFFKGTVVGLVFPLASILAIFLSVTLANYLFVDRQKRFIHGAFRHYLAPQVVDQLMRHPEKLSLAGAEQVLTVMFCDVRNFTSLSEGMDSVSLASFMNRYLTEMTRIITDHRGMLDKYIGDAIMAIWGAPLEDEDHALNAVACALAMEKRMGELRRQWLAEGLPEIGVGIGVNTGPMRVGNFGSVQLFDYTVIGDEVNLASRIEGLTKTYGCSCLVTANTRLRLPGDMKLRPVDLVKVKGKAKSVEIFEPLGEGELSAEDLSQWQDALQLYRRMCFAEARVAIESLQGRRPAKLYDLYLKRIEGFAAHPPPSDWDGSHAFDTK